MKRSQPILFVIMLLVFTPCSPASAQGTNSEEPSISTTQPTTPHTSLTIESLQQQIGHIQDTASIPEPAKALMTGLYSQAIQQLESAKQWEAKSQDFDTDLKASPDRLKKIREELSSGTLPALPKIPEDTKRLEIEQVLRQLQAELTTEQNRRNGWEAEQDRRATRRQEIPELISAARTLLQEPNPQPPSVDPEHTNTARQAQDALTQAKRIALNKEIESFQRELLCYDAQRELLQAHIDISARRILHFEKQVTEIKDLARKQAQREAAESLKEAQQELQDAHPVIKPLIEEREKYAVETQDIQRKSKDLEKQIAQVTDSLNTVKQDFNRVEERVAKVGLTNAIGQLLRQQRTKLPTLESADRELREIKDKLGKVQLEDIQLSERRAALLDSAKIITSLFDQYPETLDDNNEEIHAKAEETLISLRADIDRLRKEYNSYFLKLVDLDSKERELNETIEQFEEFIDEKILWIKSSRLPGPRDFLNARNAIGWFFSADSWNGVLKSMAGTVEANKLETVLGSLSVLLLWLLTPRLRRWIMESAEKVSRPATDSMDLTFLTLTASILLALRWPLILWLIAWTMASPYYETEFSNSIGKGFETTAYVLLLLRLFRQIARKDGLAEKHFHWNPEALRIIRRHELWIAPVVLPNILIVATLKYDFIETANDSCGRLSFVIMMFAFLLFVHRVLRPSGPVMKLLLDNMGDSRRYGLAHFIYLGTIVTLFGLIVSCILGYFYTATYLSVRVFQTVWLLLILIVISGLVERWLLYQTRKRALAESRERAAMRRQQLEGSEPSTEGEISSIPEDKLDIGVISQQTKKLVGVTLFLIGIVGFWLIWAETLPALGIFREVTLWTMTETVTEKIETAEGLSQISEYTQPVSITLSNLGLALILAFLTFVSVRNVPGLLEITVLEKLPIDAGGRFAVTSITRYAITVIGVVGAFAQLGIGWSQVQWLVAAITVGLGFGLQEIFANLVSGLMLLFERPIRIGDVVTVGTTTGKVMRIRTRATTIKNWDNKELIIPNKEFITGNVVNWTLTDTTVRIVIPVGIAYGSETRKAEQILKSIAEDHPHVLKEPEPQIVYNSFGDSSLDFELRVFIGSLDHYLTVLHDLHFAIDDRFREAEIEIAFPQRDIHIRSMPDGLNHPIQKNPLDA